MHGADIKMAEIVENPPTSSRPSVSPVGSQPDGELLFCPFCRECFEGTKECPDHELMLVPFLELPKQDEELLDLQTPFGLFEPRFGRAVLAVSALLVLAGFMMPVVTHVSAEGASQSVTGALLSARRAANLWTVPAGGAIWLSILYRRRTRAALRAARLAVMGVGLIGLVSVVFTAFRLHRGAVAAGAEVNPAVGAFLCGLGLVVGSLSVTRLGGPAE